MINEDILKFTEFLDYYYSDYAKPSCELSLPSPRDDDYNANRVPLVTSDYIMLDFDSMCKDANFYPKKNRDECNQPATADAIYYRVINEDNLELSLVEFKNFNFNWDMKKDYNASVQKVKKRLMECGLNKSSKKGLMRLESIKRTYGSTIEFSLKLKPYESLFVVLPKLYEEYCREKNIDMELNFYNFFQSDLCTIKFFVVGKRPVNDLTRAYNGKLGNLLEKQYRRLDFVNILTPHPQRLCFEGEFDEYTRNLKVHEKDNLKSLNYR